MTTGTRRPGDFCWMNMITPNPPAARAFFGELLGWTYTEMKGMGDTVHVGGRPIGGMFDLNAPSTPKGTPAYIGVMIRVESADATSAKVTALGGKAMPAFDIMEQGRMAVCFDPNGAEFDVWEAKKSTGTDVDTALPGAPSWFEALTTDVDRAAAFYAALFGWTPEAMPLPDMQYTTFKHGEGYVAGMMRITPEMGQMRPHWGTYFTVRNTDATAAQAVKLGGTVCVPARDVPGVGRFCGIVSPQGVMFYAIAYAR
jgi:uncharacterized protein